MYVFEHNLIEQTLLRLSFRLTCHLSFSVSFNLKADFGVENNTSLKHFRANMSKSKENSLANKIADILSAAPSNFDPEDEPLDATTAQIPLGDEDEPENEKEEEILSKFRKQNIDLLEDIDVKYAGRKASRKDLDSESESEDDLRSGYEQEGSDSENSFLDEGNKSEFEDSSAQEEGEEEEEESDIENTSSNEDIDEEISEGSESNFKHIKEDNFSTQLKKATCVRNQMSMWENLLEIRIQLQKCLITANKLPPHQIFNEIKHSDNKFPNKVAQSKHELCHVLEKLMLLQKILLNQYPETKQLGKKEVDKNGDNEEINSDTEESDIEENTNEDANEEKIHPKKKQRLNTYEQQITDQHNKYKEYRNNTIQKWNDKTRIAQKSATTTSIVHQIDFNLANKEKLIKKTRLKRSQYDILGVQQNNEELNPEIFDDDDFYHQLLRELIEVKSADVTDPVQLGRQWIQLQNMRSKMKRKIDTRATKGRKIRYAVHSKLVNFMAPIDENLWTDDAKTELYNSLFGRSEAGMVKT